MLRNRIVTALRRPYEARCSSLRASSNYKSQFKKISKGWWTENGPANVLREMNNVRVPFVRDGLIHTNVGNPNFKDSTQPLTGLKILDVGCGGGFLSESLAKLGADVTGIDPICDLIEIAKIHAKETEYVNNLKYLNLSINEYVKNCTEKFDAVVVSEVIEHIENKDKHSFVEACLKCLKPNCSIFFTTFDKTIASYFVAILFSEYIARTIPKGTHDWKLFCGPKELQEILEKNGCITMKVKRFAYSPVSKTWKWKSQGTSYALQAIKS